MTFVLDDIINTTQDMIKIPSISDDLINLEKNIDYIYNFFVDTNLIIEKKYYNNKPNILVKNFEWKKADIVLNGHIDVVAGSDDKQFEPYIKWNKLYWRWSIDMKWWISIIMYIMKYLDSISYKDKKISLIITSDEEIGWFDCAYNIAKDWYIWDIILIPDWWSSTRIVNTQKWLNLFEVVAQGKSCHSSRPWLGDNAINKIFNLYKDLKETFENKTKNNRYSTVNLNKIQWWKSINAIPNECIASFDIRFTEDFDDSYVRETVNKLIINNSCTVIKSIFWSCLHTDENDKNLQKFKSIASDLSWWKEINFVKEHWWSDWRFFAQYWSKIILYRPDWDNLHTFDEWIDINSFELIYNSYLKFILS